MTKTNVAKLRLGFNIVHQTCQKVKIEPEKTNVATNSKIRKK